MRVAGQRQLSTFGEFEVLLWFVQNHGRVMTREELHGPLGARTEASLRAGDTMVARLRRKLRGAQLFQIETVQRVGYRCVWLQSSSLMMGSEEPRTQRSALCDLGRDSASMED